MPLLAFKYLALLGALIHAVRLDWLSRKAWVECCRAEAGRLVRTTIEFSGIRSISASLESRQPIVRCDESQGIYTLRAAAGDLLTVRADGYTVL